MSTTGHLSSYTRNNSAFLPQTYKDHLLRDNRDEFDAAFETYRSFEYAEDPRRSERLMHCRSFAWFLCHRETREIRVASSSCKLRWCPLCARSKSYNVSASLQQYLKPLDRPKLLTLTLRHSNAPLADQIEAIYKHFQNFRRAKWLKKAIRGGIWFFQVKRSAATGQWHPHIHVLLDAGFLPHADLSDTWRKVTHGSYVVDIRTIYNIEEAADYVSRYVARPCKLSDYDLSDRQEIISALHGRRLAGSWGTARGTDLSGKSEPPDNNWERLCSWSTIREMIHDDPAAYAIYKSWQTGQPLPDGITIDDVDSFIDRAFTDEDFTPTIALTGG